MSEPPLKKYKMEVNATNDVEMTDANNNNKNNNNNNRKHGRSEDEKSALTIIYVPGGHMPALKQYIGQLIEVKIPAKHLTSQNSEIKTRSLWGTDIYTDDSDCCAILYHTGSLYMRTVPPQAYGGVEVIFRVLAGKENYQSTTRYNFKSRSWLPTYDKCSLQLVSVRKIKEMDELQLNIAHNTRRRVQAKKGKDDVPYMIMRVPEHIQQQQQQQQQSRSAKKARTAVLPDLTIVYDSQNNPTLKYSLGLAGDRGMEPAEWTSVRLKRECVYFEYNHNRYELARVNTTKNVKVEKYKWSEVIQYPSWTAHGNKKSAQNKASKVPLPASCIKVLANDLRWDEIQWGPESISIRNQIYPIYTCRFKKIN